MRICGSTELRGVDIGILKLLKPYCVRDRSLAIAIKQGHQQERYTRLKERLSQKTID